MNPFAISMSRHHRQYRLIISGLKTILIPIAGFFVILAVLNGYQYFKLKSNLAGPVINTISTVENHELQYFFNSVAQTLKIVRSWAKNGLLNNNDTIALNGKFMPLIEHQAHLSGILLADNQGQEYFLSKDGESWLTRIRRLDHKGILLYEKWATPNKSIKKWREKSDYSPLSRPWFHHSENNDAIYWTPVYTFFNKKIQGISASVSWDIQKTPDRFAVFALDIPLKELRSLLNINNSERLTTLFLVNPFSDYFILGDDGDVTKQSSRTYLVPELIKEWKKAGKPSQQILRIQNNKQQWLATFKPMVADNSGIWVGVAASENELVAGLNDTLFHIDLMDFLVASAGGVAMLLLVWLNGGLRSRKNSEFEDPVLKLHRLINQGEGNNVEFKSTVRMNLKNGKAGKEIEFAWLKAVIAFLNSDGGTLLIGVADDGRIHGLEADDFENDDRCLLHIKNLFNQHVGAEFSDFSNFTLVEIEEKKVVIVDCQPAGKPVFLRVGKNEEFYIRSGPSNSKLTPSQMIRYIQQKK